LYTEVQDPREGHRGLRTGESGGGIEDAGSGKKQEDRKEMKLIVVRKKKRRGRRKEREEGGELTWWGKTWSTGDADIERLPSAKGRHRPTGKREKLDDAD